MSHHFYQLHLPSLKLTVRTWKWAVCPKGKLVLVFQPSIFRGEHVSFREGKSFHLLDLDAPKVPKLELPSVQFAFAMHLAALVSSHPPQWAVAMKFKVGQRLATSDIIVRKPPTGPPNINKNLVLSQQGSPPSLLQPAWWRSCEVDRAANVLWNGRPKGNRFQWNPGWFKKRFPSRSVGRMIRPTEVSVWFISHMTHLYYVYIYIWIYILIQITNNHSHQGCYTNSFQEIVTRSWISLLAAWEGFLIPQRKYWNQYVYIYISIIARCHTSQ